MDRDAIKVKLKISTHNVNGFKSSEQFLYSQCENAPLSIQAIQKHWLKPAIRKQQGVNLLKSVHPDFDGYGTPAMKPKMATAVLHGRPFGGTGFIFSKSLALALKPCMKYQHEQVSVSFSGVL
jgi:hypothetical protein